MMMKKSVSGAASTMRQQTRSRLNVVASISGKAKTVKGTISGKKSTATASVNDNKAFLLSLPGVTAPFNDVFDPLNLAAGASEKDILRWRESEITHGRVAMLAALGFIIGENLEDFPAFFNFDGHITGPAITHFNQVGQGFWEPLLIAIGLAESYRVNVGWATPRGSGFNALQDDYEPGNLGFDPLGLLKNADDAQVKELQTKELNNGRLAMIAIAAFVLQEVAAPGTDIFEHTFFNIEKELIEEIDDIEREVGLPLTPIPSLPILN